jgi:hypothetical protein
VENKVYGLVRLGWEERVGGRVEYLDAEEVSDKGDENGGSCEADAGGRTDDLHSPLTPPL